MHAMERKIRVDGNGHGGPGIQRSLSGWKGPQQVERRGPVLWEETTAGMVQWYK